MTKYFYILSIAALVFLFACSEVKDDITVPATVSVHGEGVLTPESADFHGKLDDSGMDLCLECHGANFDGGTAQSSCVECHSTIALHKEGILQTSSDNFHGKYFAANQIDMDACSMCHGSDFAGGVSSPGCVECHSTISVHQAGIVDPASDAFHAKFMKSNNADLAACGSCHGTNLLGGTSAPTCATCHTGIDVHQTGILDGTSANFHGKFIADNNIDLSTCSSCHGSDFKGGLLATNCTTCHTTIDVHTSMTLESHGQYFADQNLDINSCSSCHGVDFEGGDSAPACATCHSTINVHKEGITDPASPNFHGKYMADNSADLEACASCHGIDFTGGVAAPGCTTCHETIGVHQDGITDSESPNFHGKYFAGNDASLTECSSCHGTDFSGGMVASGCVTCHSSINVHQDGYDDETSDKFHGKFLGANNLELEACSTCHGTGFEGGESAPGCITCHPSIGIHQDGIIETGSDNFHSKFMLANSFELDDCASCHGSDFTGGSSATTCVTCHNSIGVHQDGLLDKDSDKFHGKFLGVNNLELADCATCHGEDLSGGTLASNCVTCHPTVGIHKDGIIDANSDNFHGKFIAANNTELTECASCHGVDFTGGSSATTCVTCHSSVGVHKEGIMSKDSPDFHGKFLGANNAELEDCSTCHGSDFEGGAAAPGCVTCHATIVVHKDGILDQNSTNFHGTYINSNEIQLTECASCHGVDFTGGSSAPSCVTCHAGIGVHTANIMTTGSDEFHGYFFGNSDAGLSSCATCHGSEYEGGEFAPSCVTCHDQTIIVHKDGVVDVNSDNFHGKFMADNSIEFEPCQTCHGEDFAGGMSAPGCVTCHSSIDVHSGEINHPYSDKFHGLYMINNAWDLGDCKTCHSTDFSGGLMAPSCESCHVYDDGPEACNTCHGDFGDIARPAPPKDLARHIETTYSGVGAHANHLYDGKLGADVQCYQCHTEPASVAGHIDDLPAEIVFGSLADPNSSAQYDFNSNTCSNTYCHGNFELVKANSAYPHIYEDGADKITGNNFTPDWTVVDGSQAACGTCHGEVDESGNFVKAEPTGHKVFSGGFATCSGCHIGVIDSDGNIVDRQKHINGVVNVFGN